MSACAVTPPPAALNATASPKPNAQANPALDGLLQGQILMPPGVSLPEASRLQLVLLNRFPAQPDQGPLAASESVITTAPPLQFRLPFARSRVGDVTVYRLDVAVFDTQGRLILVSDGEHPVNLGVEAEPTRIELMAVGSGSQQQAVYDCGTLLAEVRVADPDLRLTVADRPYQLRRAHAANGLRYIGSDAEFWSRGEEARIQLGGESLRCQRLADRS